MNHNPHKNLNDRPKKLQRISQACDLCHRRSIRCRPSAENPQHQCQNCYDFAVDCTYNRPSRRRRNPSLGGPVPPHNLLPTQQHRPSSRSVSPAPVCYPPARSADGWKPTSPIVKVEGGHVQNPFHTIQPVSDTNTFSASPSDGGPDVPGVSLAWRSFAAASQPIIDHYLEIYMNVIYPLFPLFHEPTMWDRIRRQSHLTDRSFFASIMAACALTAARARDGAVGETYHFQENLEHSSELFFAAAQEAIPKDLTAATGLGYLRACALLALTSIQHGQVQTMHLYMGHFATLTTMQGFQNEEYWPVGISLEEQEERRRLFWSMYTFDVFTSVVFNAPLRLHESNANVAYPSETTDEDISSHGAVTYNANSWLRGWNFTTDLYRVLEHTILRLRTNQLRRDDRISTVRAMMSSTVPELQIMEKVVDLYFQLPARFQDTKAPVTLDRARDIYGFQAANIQAALQLVRITLFESYDSHNMHQKCDVAEEVLNTFRNIAPPYLAAISTPLVYHLGTIGHFLATAMQGVLREDSYDRVRQLLTQLADLLQDLEKGLQPAAGSSKELRLQIARIDQYMHAQRQMLAALPQQHTPTSMSETNAGNGSVVSSLPDATTVTTTTTTTTTLPQQQQQTNALGMRTPLDEFQLPQELTAEGWPWPFDLSSAAAAAAAAHEPGGGQQQQQQHHHHPAIHPAGNGYSSGHQ